MTPAPAPPDHGETRFLTGEAVHLDVRVARLGSRVLARLIDLVAQFALAFTLFTGLTMLAGLAGITGAVIVDQAVLQTIVIIVIVVTLLGYPVLLETLTRGRTLGKMALGLRAVRDDGGPITFRQALARGLVGVAVEFPGLVLPPLTWLATIWAMVVNPQSKRIGDHVAGTIVVHESTPAAWGWVPSMPRGLEGWALTLDLTGLDDELALVVRHYLARNRSLREPARTALGLRLAHEVAAVTNPPPPPGTPGWMYLAAVHAERHRRAVRQLVAMRARSATVWPDLAQATAVPQPVQPTVPAAGSTAAPRPTGGTLPPLPRPADYVDAGGQR